MEQIFIKNVKINKVRHLKNIDIQICDDKRKHVILTGKNGSGKTSVLDAIASFIRLVTTEESPKGTVNYTKGLLLNSIEGVWLEFNKPDMLKKLFDAGKFVVAYYKADRVFKSVKPKHVEKVELQSDYAITDEPRTEFIKYLLDMKMTQALALSNGKKEKAHAISEWFIKFDDLLKRIFDDSSVRLEFDEETFDFSIIMDGREPFDFNTLSSGYAAVFDIVVDLMMRMEKQLNRSFDFSIPGVVLVDEIETHLHLELQKNVMKLLTTIFPNIQFIVSSHSPFILNSLDDVVIYDLENKVLVKDGLADIPYSGIVEGYFHADELSDELREKFDAYKKLADKQELEPDDYEQIADLEMYLNEIPDYLALNLTTQYEELKRKLREREEIW